MGREIVLCQQERTGTTQFEIGATEIPLVGIIADPFHFVTKEDMIDALRRDVAVLKSRGMVPRDLAEKTKSLEPLQLKAAERITGIARKCSSGSMDESSVRSLINAFTQPEVVVNLATNKIHSTIGNHFSEPPLTWSTNCGWRWIESGRLTRLVTSKENLPVEATVCEKCMEWLPRWLN